MISIVPDKNAGKRNNHLLTQFLKK